MKTTPKKVHAGSKLTVGIPVPDKTGHGTEKREQSGVVAFCVYGKNVAGKSGSAGTSDAKKFAPSNLVQVIEDGLRVQELDDLQASLEVPMERLFPLLGISKATHHRRKASGKLDAGESDRVVRFARLMGKAVEVMECADNARRWLTAPQVGLGGAVPLDFARTEVGAREVEDLLGRIEYGVYS